MRTITILALAIIAATRSPTVHAVSFNELEMWTQGEFYQRGEIVRQGYDIYINILPSRTDSPDTGTPRWKKIDYNTRRDFVARALYPIGSVASHEGKHYISLGMNATHGTKSLTDSSRWLEFTHPGLTYGLPPETATPDEINSLIGADTNFNGIRDDYELAIIFGSLPSPVKDAALSAGKAYGLLLMTASDGADLTREEALGILHKLVLARACRAEMQELHQGTTWQESTYFNNLDRLEAKFKLQNMVASVLGENGYTLPRDPSPCLTLVSI